MLSILNLALPFFGVIFIGFACGKWRRIPDAGLAWMNFFILYVALPALFFRILSRTPLEQLAQIDFVTATVLASASAFTIAYIVGLILRRGNLGEATIAAVAGGFGNVGYMGPGLSLAAIGPEAAVPVALIFSFDALLIFTLVPLLMAFSGSSTGLGRALRDVARSIFLNPLLIAAALGVGAAALKWEPPEAVDRLLQFLYTSAAPCALFALGVTVALRPLERMPWEVPLLAAVKLVVHPIAGAGAARLARAVQRGLGQYRRADGRPAAGALGLRVRPPVRRLDRAGLQRRADRHARLRRHPHRRHVARADARPGAAAAAVVGFPAPAIRGRITK